MAPIHDACRAGDVEAVRRELAAGVSPDLRASTLNSFPHDLPNSIPVWTPLCIALVYRGNYQSETTLLETVSLLKEAGADVDAVCANQQNSGVYTALWFAAHGGKRNLVAALIAAGASTSLHVEGGYLQSPSPEGTVDLYVFFLDFVRCSKTSPWNQSSTHFYAMGIFAGCSEASF